MRKKSIQPMDLDKVFSGFSSALACAAQAIHTGEKPEVISRHVDWCNEFAATIIKDGRTDEILARLSHTSVEVPAILGVSEQSRRRSPLVALLEPTAPAYIEPAAA
jgi:3-oxoacyl-[acyl-carrier-protein] synthase III